MAELKCFLFVCLVACSIINFFFFFNDTATTEIYTLSLHDALPIPCPCNVLPSRRRIIDTTTGRTGDRKSTRLNSSHVEISYAVFCLKKQKKTHWLPRNATKMTRKRTRNSCTTQK